VFAPAKALAHAHAQKHPTITCLKLMRVSALIQKKSIASTSGAIAIDYPGVVSIGEPLAMPLPEKRPSPAAICRIGSGGTAAAEYANNGNGVRNDEPLAVKRILKPCAHCVAGMCSRPVCRSEDAPKHRRTTSVSHRSAAEMIRQCRRTRGDESARVDVRATFAEAKIRSLMCAS
jgi:hypothetical protein